MSASAVAVDADTQCRYDDAITEIANRACIAPGIVTETATSLAAAFPDRDARLGDISAYLLAEGRPQLEQALGYRASRWRRIERAIRERIGGLYVLCVVLIWIASLAGAGALYVQLGGGALGCTLLVVGLMPIFVDLARRLTELGLLLPLASRAVVLPKLDFATRIPRECATIVVHPVIVHRHSEITELVATLETGYLCNPDPGLSFWLITDLSDADAEELPTDQEILARIADAIRELNQRHGAGGHTLFHHLHRRRRYNAIARRWMGWERKRGKLVELNRLILGADETTLSFEPSIGDRAVLRAARYVITLDADTLLLPGTAARLIGALAHPLNRARFDAGGRVVAGYSILQPRVVLPPWGHSRLNRLISLRDPRALTPHPVRAISQLVLGEGQFWGKGIYDVAAFERAVAGQFPENWVLSHDKLEGGLARASFATEIVLFESAPRHVSSFLMRKHRWTRGDVQSLPWALPYAPSERGWQRSPLAALNRLVLLQESVGALRQPPLLALLLAAWLGVLPGNSALWTLIVLVVPAVAGLAFFAMVFPWRFVLPNMLRAFGFGIVTLPAEAILISDAFVRALYRMTPLGRHRALEWTTAAAAEGKGPTDLASYWRASFATPVAAVVLGVAIAMCNPWGLIVAAPFLACWVVAPTIYHWMSQPVVSEVSELTPLPDRLLQWCAAQGRPVAPPPTGDAP